MSVTGSSRAPPEMLGRQLLALVRRAREQSAEDPFGSPVLTIALAITRQIDRDELGEPELTGLIGHFAERAYADRADRLRAFVGLDRACGISAMRAVAARLASAEPKSSFDAFKAAVERVRFAAVFTAHPTFSMPRALAGRLSATASSELPPQRASDHAAASTSHRPANRLTLDDEFAWSRTAVHNGREALDRLTEALLATARERWPERWTELTPRPVILASWVGSDTDGRTDIGWWDTLRFRLESKRSQLSRLLDRLPQDESAGRVRALAEEALSAVRDQLALAPPLGGSPSLEQVHGFALALVRDRERAQTSASGLLAALDDAVQKCQSEESRLALCVARAGLASHGLAHALPHFRLNAAQVHNAVRRAVKLEGDPADPAQRRTHLVAINRLLAEVRPVPVDFGALAAEGASASRLLMTAAQLLKHIDGSNPVRLLIAETETGYTLLVALWLAKRFGIAERVEITPLFETAEALENGGRVLDEALRSPAWREHLRAVGRLTVQFGYSDSGRYIGQLASTFWIERLRLRIADTLARHGLRGLELVLFDTHGESIGRGGHPASLTDRLAYLAPAQSRRKLAEAGLAVRLESSFQGGDGYLLFGTPALAAATVARIAEHSFADASSSGSDPVYDEPDFSTDFFSTIRQEMERLVEEPGYAVLLGAFGPNLLDRTGSRPAARQSEHARGLVSVSHPRELRAIPNNAILLQLGWLANSLHGVGRAAGRSPDLFRQLRAESERFGRALALAERAAALSDLDVLRAYIDTLDPNVWLDRARRTRRPGRREELVTIASALEHIALAPALRRLFSRLARDWLLLKSALPELPEMADRLFLLHGLRLAIIHRIWFLATHIPAFRPHHGVTREALIERILRLELAESLDSLSEIFPVSPDPTLGIDFGEPPGPREGGTYEMEHRTIIEPMRRLFALVREISAAIQHEAGAFG